ncbi:MAG: ABC transporter permease [Limisphaerales bacterium]
MSRTRRQLLLLALDQTPMILFVVVALGFAALSPAFREPKNLVAIVLQSASTAVVAVGMTFVLLTGGVDLSVGAVMFVGAAVAGKLVLGGAPLAAALLAMLAVGLVCGAINAVFITRFGVMAFVVTLATLYLGRGLALWITDTRAMNLPEDFLRLGTAQVARLPVPVLVLGGVLAAAHVVLTRTPFGRQIYAVGHNIETARKAGINTRLILASVYVISGLCAAIGGVISLAQLGAVSPTFGTQKEFSAIAAAVLGGTSLFGGRGSVFPGTVLGAMLIQMVQNGLVILNANPYLYPLITSGIIFAAVLIDTGRLSLLARMNRRMILADRNTGTVAARPADDIT